MVNTVAVKMKVQSFLADRGGGQDKGSEGRIEGFR